MEYQFTYCYGAILPLDNMGESEVEKVNPNQPQGRLGQNTSAGL